MRKIILIAHNVRSAHNVGSLLRTADGLGVEKVYLTGYTPHPSQTTDTRLPHIARSDHSKISKTALGAEAYVANEYVEDIFRVVKNLQDEGFTVCALEQNLKSIELAKYRPPEKVALVVGREVEGIEPEVLERVDSILQIPMFGHKESYNVAQAAAMALYHLRFTDKEN